MITKNQINLSLMIKENVLQKIFFKISRKFLTTLVKTKKRLYIFIKIKNTVICKYNFFEIILLSFFCSKFFFSRFQSKKNYDDHVPIESLIRMTCELILKQKLCIVKFVASYVYFDISYIHNSIKLFYTCMRNTENTLKANT